MTCEICLEKESKYCCPGCGRRTCSLACVREHKVKFACEGLKGRPTAPEAALGPEKYSEDLFLKDYAFLENVGMYAGQLEHTAKTVKNTDDGDDVKRKERVAEFKKIQKVGKLAELRMLPASFSRSKNNRTHLIRKSETNEDANSINDQFNTAPDQQSSRMARIAWTLDLVHYDTGRMIETKFDVADDTILSELFAENIKRVFLRNETKTSGTEKWREVTDDWRLKRLKQVLVGARCFEYPIFGVEYKNETEEENASE